MEFKVANELSLAGLAIRRGRIVELSATGLIEVEGAMQERLPCEVLRTSAGPPTPFRVGDGVLYAVDEEATRGYVLGVLGKHVPSAGAEAAAEPPPSELTLSAEERIEIRCGKSLLAMDREGKVLVRGVKVTSHAGETQRIRGGTVKIN